MQQGADWSINYEWARNTRTHELEIKKALRNGTYADLNVYFTPAPDGLLWSVYPQHITSNTSDEFYWDGVVVSSYQVVDGPQFVYNAGLQAVVVIGHWLNCTSYSATLCFHVTELLLSHLWKHH